MLVRDFGEFGPNEDLEKLKAYLKATDKMLDCLASPLRKRVLIALLCGDKNEQEIKKDIEQMSLWNQKTIKSTLGRLVYDSLIKKEGINYRLTKKGQKFAQIFTLCQEIYGDNSGTA